MFPIIDEDEERRRQAQQASLRGMFRRGPYPQSPATPPFVAPQSDTVTFDRRQMGNPFVRAQQQPVAQQPAPVMSATGVAPVAQPDAVLPKDIPPEGMGGKAPASPFSRRLNRPYDTVEEDEQRLRELEDKPEGFWKRLGVAATQGLRAATDQPITPIATRRDRDILKFQNRIKRGLEQQQKDMVDVQLNTGEWVRVPARSAGTLQSRQQEIDLRGDTLEARKKRWGSMGEHEAAGDAQRLYNSGAADDSAELRAEIARRLGLPAGTVLPPRGLGNQIKTDEFGNYTVVNPRNAQATTVTDVKTTQPTQSFDATKQAELTASKAAAEKAKQDRFNANQKRLKAEADRKAALAAKKAGTGGLKADAADRRAALKIWDEKLSSHNTEIDEINRKIDELNKMDDPTAATRYNPKGAENVGPGKTFNPNESIKNQQLRRLDQDRKDAITAARNAIETATGYNSGLDFKIDDNGRVSKTQRQASDLDNPIVGVPTRSRGTLQGAIDAFKNRAGREPNAQELENIKRVFRQ